MKPTYTKQMKDCDRVKKTNKKKSYYSQWSTEENYRKDAIT